MMLGGGQSSALHLGLFGLSLLGEVNTIIKRYRNNDKTLFYLSSTISQLEQLSELVFEHLNEKVEPLIYFFEVIKAMLKLKEYKELITKEKMGCYISKERYEEHKKEEEKKKAMLMLPRSGKYLPKPEKFPVSNKMLKYAIKNVNSIDSLASMDSSPALHNLNYYREAPIGQESKKSTSKGLVSRFIGYFLKKFRLLRKLFGSRKFNITEILLIIRPVLYMLMLLRLGNSSYKPFLVSLGIELLVIFFGVYRIAKFRSDAEKDELMTRWKGMLKYLLKEPFFSKYTAKYLFIILRRIISDGKIGYILSFLTYFKYYCYIA